MFGKKKDSKKLSESSQDNDDKSRQKLFKTLSVSEKRLRRSTIGPSSTSSPTTQYDSFHAPFLKMTQQSAQSKSSDTVFERTKESLATEEVKPRRRGSLLTPLLNLSPTRERKNTKLSVVEETEVSVGPRSRSSSADDSKKPLTPKKKRLPFFKKDKKNEHVGLDEKKAQKDKHRKKLQKQLDKIDKEKAKEELDRFTDSLSETLEQGRQISVPEPSPRREIVPPQRPHVIMT